MALRPRGPTLGLGGSFIKDCFWGSSIRVSRKSWHMLLNLCFHMAMTSAIFAGGITLTNYQTVCQAVSRRRDQGGGLQDQWWQHRVGRRSGGKGVCAYRGRRA